MTSPNDPDTFILKFLPGVLLDWGLRDVKALDDIKKEIKVRVDGKTKSDDFEFLETDDAVIIEAMDSHSSFVRATFGDPKFFHWKRGVKARR